MLETKRCVLSMFRKSDYIDAAKLLTSSEVRAFLGGPREPGSIETILNDMHYSKEGCSYWAVRERRTRNFIGLVSLDPHHEGIYQEVSFQFIPDWWGKGYATETVAAVIDFAMNDLNLPTIVAETQSANLPSCRLLEKLGMKLERKVIRYGAEQSIYSLQSNKI